WLVHHPLGVRAVEREGRDRHREALAVLRVHLVFAAHRAVRRRERAAARIREGLAGLQHRLLADDAGSTHFLQLAVAVDDAPVARLELHRLDAEIGDLYRVGPEEAALSGRRFLLEELGTHGDLDASGHGLVHGQAPDGAARPR